MFWLHGRVLLRSLAITLTFWPRPNVIAACITVHASSSGIVRCGCSIKLLSWNRSATVHTYNRYRSPHGVVVDCSSALAGRWITPVVCPLIKDDLSTSCQDWVLADVTGTCWQPRLRKQQQAQNTPWKRLYCVIALFDLAVPKHSLITRLLAAGAVFTVLSEHVHDRQARHCPPTHCPTFIVPPWLDEATHRLTSFA